MSHDYDEKVALILATNKL